MTNRPKRPSGLDGWEPGGPDPFYKGPSTLRLGAVTALETQVLIEGLGHVPGVTLEGGTGPAIETSFKGAALDAALLPPLLCLGCPDTRVVPGLGVFCYGAAGTEILALERPLAAVRRVGVAPGAAALCPLARLIFAEEGVKSLEFLPLSEGGEQPHVDGVLYADAAALRYAAEGHDCVDLGQLWLQRTEHPLPRFLWVQQRHAPAARLRQVLHRAARNGEAAAESLCAAYAGTNGIEEDRVRRHIFESIYFRFGDREMASLRALLARAIQHGLLPEGASLDLC